MTVVLLVEGEAQAVKPGAEVVRLFKEKYDWNIETDTFYTLTIEIVVGKRIGG